MKLKKKMLTIFLKRARLPVGMKLNEYIAFYSKLQKKYGNKKDLKLSFKYGYYGSAYWLVERRLETDAELTVRQRKVDAEIVRRKASAERRRIARQVLIAQDRARKKQAQDRLKKTMLEKKIEHVKTMVKVLRAAGYTISPKVVSKISS